MNGIDQSSDRIRRLRLEKDFSQRELAKLLEMSATTLSRYENNPRNSNWELLRRLALELNTSADYLLGITDVKAAIKDVLRVSTDKRLDWDLFEKFISLAPGQQIALLEATSYLTKNEK